MCTRGEPRPRACTPAPSPQPPLHALHVILCVILCVPRYVSLRYTCTAPALLGLVSHRGLASHTARRCSSVRASRTLATTTQVNTRLTNLDLGDNGVALQGCQALAAMLGLNTTLARLGAPPPRGGRPEGGPRSLATTPALGAPAPAAAPTPATAPAPAPAPAPAHLCPPPPPPPTHPHPPTYPTPPTHPLAPFPHPRPNAAARRRLEECGRPGRRGGQGFAAGGAGEAKGAAQPADDRRAGAAVERGWLRGRRRVDAVEITEDAVDWCMVAGATGLEDTCAGNEVFRVRRVSL
jgi:hypothetical protein